MSNITQFFSSSTDFDSACAVGSRVDIGCARPTLICKAGGTAWIVAPRESELYTTWYCLSCVTQMAEDITGLKGWFIPVTTQLQNPGYCCRDQWDGFTSALYWSSTEWTVHCATTVHFAAGTVYCRNKNGGCPARAFRCVTY